MICNDPSTNRRNNSEYYYKHGVSQATVFYNEESRHVFAFNQTSGDLITGYKQREKAFNNFVDNNTLGNKK
jgi:hypothetical protein